MTICSNCGVENGDELCSNCGFLTTASPTRTWFFEDPTRVAALHIAIADWRGTPFAESSRAKGPGGGIDCVGYAEVIMAGAGLPETFEFPRSPADYAGHAHNDKILRYLRGQHSDQQSAILAARFAELTDQIANLVPVASWPHGRVLSTGLRPGDIAIIKAKIPGVWHFAIMVNDRTFTHCAYDQGVTEGDITEGHIRPRLKAVFRARALSLS